MDSSAVAHAVALVVRQLANGTDADQNQTVTVPLAGQPGHCEGSNEYNGSLGVRISAIFVIFIGSLFGAWFPVFTRGRTQDPLFDKLFFVAKYFGSGVIIATSFIHLLAPANEALTNPCLTGPITEYSWVEGIILMTVFTQFFVELMVMRYATFGESDGHAHGGSNPSQELSTFNGSELDQRLKSGAVQTNETTHRLSTYQEDHLGHTREHVASSDVPEIYATRNFIPESYGAQMTAIFILEFGVIFHSIFVGLTLAVAGDEFTTLYIVLVFHQTFEGLGLGTRIAGAPWPKSKRWTPYLLGLGYACSTPIAMSIGLGLRNTWVPGSATSLIVNGVFDSISAGILIYTGLIELMAHEFMFSPAMQQAKISTVLAAFGFMCFGAGIMALLGKWA